MMFYIYDLLGPVEGRSLGSTWNGWECPEFPKASADRLVEHWNARFEVGPIEQPCAWFDEESRRYAFYLPDSGGEVDTFEARRADDGAEWWAIGAGGWTWERTSYLQACHFCGAAWGQCTCHFAQADATGAAGFTFGDVFVTSPAVSVCGRFYVQPSDYYGEDYERAYCAGTWPGLVDPRLAVFCNDGDTANAWTLTGFLEANRDDPEAAEKLAELQALAVGGEVRFGIGGGWTTVRRLS